MKNLLIKNHLFFYAMTGLLCLVSTACSNVARDNQAEQVQTSPEPARIEDKSIPLPPEVKEDRDARYTIKHFDSLYLKMDELDAKVIFRKESNDKSPFPLKIKSSQGDLQGEVTVTGSSSRNFPKKNLKIKLKKGNNWRGHRIISLDAMATDGSLMREWLAWELIHKLKMPAPQVRYLRVYINDQYHGVFLLTEWIDPKVMSTFGLGENGQFFHPIDSRYCGDFSHYPENSLEDCWFKLSPGNKDFTPLQNLSDAINNTSIEGFSDLNDKIIDNDTLINWLLVNVLTSNGDTYNKNYFLYQNEFNLKWNFIPWDYDLSFGRNWDAFLPFPENVNSENFVYFYPPQLGASNPVKEKALRNPELRERFFQRLFHLLGVEKNGPDETFGWFTPKQMHARIKQMGDQLYKNRIGDPFLENNIVNYRHESESIWHYTQRRHAYLLEILTGDRPWDADQAIWEYDLETPKKRSPLALEQHQRQEVTLPYGQLVNDKGEYDLIIVPNYGLLMAGIRPRDGQGKANFAIDTFVGETPTIIPPGFKASQCIQRNWSIILLTPFQKRRIDLQLDYIQENSRRHEMGSDVIENQLTLWKLDGETWQQHPASFNPRSNVITIDNVEMESNRMLQFAACSEG